MMDVTHEILKWIDYNRGYLIGATFAAVASWSVLGCEPKAPSLVDPTKMVTAMQIRSEDMSIREQLAADQAALDARRQAHEQKTGVVYEDLQEQAARNKALIEGLGGIASTVVDGSISPGSAIGTITQLALLGLTGGGFLNARRKDKVIDSLKKNGGTSPA